jgi:peptidoglycan/xylan/chitin deacetylase (PgdA/CDA1 family)
VSALSRAGFEIGFHTRRHDRLPDLPDAALQVALESGRDAIADAAGADPRLIAYPHGRADERVAAAARGAGYSFGFSDRPEPVRPASDPLLLGRLVPSPYSVRHFASQLAKTSLGLLTRFAPP